MPAGAKQKRPPFKKAPPELVARFEDAIRPLPEAELKTMFGYPAAFVAGQMFAGVFIDAIVVRLPEAERATLLESGGGHLHEMMPGRPLREYIGLKPSIVQDDAAFDGWLRKAMAYARLLPGKKKK